MAAKPRRLWTGQRRADVMRLKRLLNQLLNWDTKPTPVPFLTAAQVVIINSMATNVVAPLLAATKVP